MTVTITLDAASERSTVGRIMSETGRATLAELADVAERTGAHFYPVCRLTGIPSSSRLESHVVQVADA